MFAVEEGEMAYLLNLFTPETWLAFRESGATVTGFRERHRRLAGERVRQGDIFLVLPDPTLAMVRRVRGSV